MLVEVKCLLCDRTGYYVVYRRGSLPGNIQSYEGKGYRSLPLDGSDPAPPLARSSVTPNFMGSVSVLMVVGYS